MADTDGMELRLAQYINYKTNGKKAAFARSLGWSNQYLTNLLKGTTSIGLAPVATLLKTYPDLSARWLLFGEGAMIEGVSNNMKRQLMALLRLDNYIAVMSPAEIKAVQAGQYEWKDSDYERWERLAHERKAAINARFKKSMDKQN